MLVLVTIHGIGFQQAPSQEPGAFDGYADLLHQHLLQQPKLGGGVLGDDPNRKGVSGPVYVESSWPPDTNQAEEGLKRLGSWKDGTIDHSDAPLAQEGARIAHVALVYSGLEDQQRDPIALLDVIALGLPSLTHYATIGGIVRAAFDDLRGLHGRAVAPVQGLTPRKEAAQHRGFISRLLHRGADATKTPSTLAEIEDDVAAYVVRNDHRERVRSFIREALTRLLYRDDVDGVVLNTHSNGTVMGFDLIAALPPQLAPRVSGLITAGSPLRKYVDFMDWGTDARNFYWSPTGSTISGIAGGPTPAWPAGLQWWTNFVDNDDPVADPLQPPVEWKLGQEQPPGGGPGLFVVYDPEKGTSAHVPIADVVVDNVHAPGVGGDLPAHNYWDNTGQFCSKAADMLDFVINQPRSVNLSGAAVRSGSARPQ